MLHGTSPSGKENKTTDHDKKRDVSKPVQAKTAEADFEAYIKLPPGQIERSFSGKKMIFLISAWKGIRPGHSDKNSYQQTFLFFNKISKIAPADYTFIVGGGSVVNFNKSQWQRMLEGLKQNPTQEEMTNYIENHYLQYAEETAEAFFAKYNSGTVREDLKKKPSEKSDKKAVVINLEPNQFTWRQIVEKLSENSIEKNYHYWLKHYTELYQTSSQFRSEVNEIRNSFLHNKSGEIERIKKMVTEELGRSDLVSNDFEGMINDVCVSFLLSEYAVITTFNHAVYFYGGVDFSKNFVTAFENNKSNSAYGIFFEKYNAPKKTKLSTMESTSEITRTLEQYPRYRSKPIQIPKASSDSDESTPSSQADDEEKLTPKSQFYIRQLLRARRNSHAKQNLYNQLDTILPRNSPSGYLSDPESESGEEQQTTVIRVKV